jgi:RNA-directed DNA polymerase
LTNDLMERVCDPKNLNQAYKRVKANGGAPGVDGRRVTELNPWLAEHKQDLIRSLLEGSYRPELVLAVEIPKADGGTRQLGIPTVVDRLVQQAILQVLDPLLDPTFSESSYGFRPGRNAHQALRQAQNYIADGRDIVVDLDLEKFFDRVNHDILMSRLARRIADKRLLRIIRRFLEAGILRQGVCVERYEGTPQGGPLSPLLANLLLDDLDKELERRGHCFCRYADDSNIYVRSEAAGQRVMASITVFLEDHLRLRVNRDKSAVAAVRDRKFLGYRLGSEGRLGIAPTSLKRAKERVRQITRRNRGISFGRMIQELNEFLTGWVTYFRLAEGSSSLNKLDGWIRRKLRCVRLKQKKRSHPIAKFLRSLGVPESRAWLLAGGGKGWWRKAGSPPATEAMTNRWFRDQGLVSLADRHASYNAQRNRRIR